MESVWWVFSTLHKKGLVYQGFKVQVGDISAEHVHAVHSTCCIPRRMIGHELRTWLLQFVLPANFG